MTRHRLKNHYYRIGLKNLRNSLKRAENLSSAIDEYNKNVSGTVITANSVSMAVGTSILKALLPTIIKENKKLIAKQLRKLK